MPIKCNHCNGTGEMKQDFIRSLSQNAYYRVVLIMIAREIGEPEEVVHELMKYMFNSNKEYVTGNLKGVTTTKSTTKSFEIYLQKIKYWAKNYLGILINVFLKKFIQFS